MNDSETFLVSIIIPIYNVESYLVHCLESCVNQTYKNIEIVCVDDGSIDNSFKIIESYRIKDNRIKVLRQLNSGVVIAREVGVKAATGDFLFFLDGDDYISSFAIEVLVEQHKICKSDVIIANLLYDHGNKFAPLVFNIPHIVNKVEIIKLLLLDKLPLSLGAKLIKKDVFQKISIPSNLKIGEDAFATLILIDIVSGVSFINTPIYYYVSRPTSAMVRPTILAIQSRLSFIEYVVSYFNKKPEFINDKSFQKVLSYFVLNQYYSFLRMGGNRVEHGMFSNYIKKIYYSDLEVKKELPIWRSLLIFFSFKNSFLLKTIILFINSGRKLRNYF